MLLSRNRQLISPTKMTAMTRIAV